MKDYLRKKNDTLHLKMHRINLLGGKNMAIFDKEAQTYDSWYQTTLGSYVFQKESRLLSKMIGETSCKNMLEVGCATGIHSRFLIRDDNRITGVDISNEMIAEAKKYQSENLRFTVMDALHLDFKDNTFDIVFSATMIEFIEKKQDLYQELLRVLKPGGFLVIGTIQKGSSFYDLYQTPYFQENTVFKHARFLGLQDLIDLGTTEFVTFEECLFNTPKELEENEMLEDIKKDKPGSFLVCVYQKGEI